MMTLFSKLDPGDAVVSLTINVLVQIAVVVVLAWAIATIFARRRAAVRHGIWLAALGCVFVSPIAAYVAAKADVSVISVSSWLPHWAEGLTFTQPRATPSLLHASLNSYNPEGRSTIAQRFIAGAESEEIRSSVPEGQLKSLPEASHSSVPTGREQSQTPVSPAVNCRAIAERPSGTDIAYLRPLLGMIVAVWAAGVFYFLVRLLHGWWNVRQSYRRLKYLDEDRLNDVLPEVRRALNLTKELPKLATWQGEELAGPLTMGVFRPVVILPETLLKKLDRSGLRDVLIHEFAHAVRRDPLVGFLQRLAAIIYWPYPPVHFLNRQLAAAREEVCDNYVLQQGDASRYADTLLKISETVLSHRLRPASLGLLHPHGKLEHRVARLLDSRRKTMVRMHRVTWAVLTALFLTAVVAVAGTRLLQAEPPTAPASPTATKATIQWRTVNKLVKDFPEKVDLSTPESAAAACNRAWARMDDQAVLELSWVKWGQHDIDRTKQFRDSHPKETAIKNDAQLNAEILEVATYRDDLAEVIYKEKAPKGVDIGGNPFTAQSFGQINGEWKNLGGGAFPTLQAAKEDFEKKKDSLWQHFVTVRDNVKNGRSNLPESSDIPDRGARIAPGESLGISVEKADLMGRVEWAMMHGGRDITARKTIEWGDVEKDKDGNRSIRYKFFATIWDRDVYVMNLVFTFDNKGNIIRRDNVEGFPQKKIEKPIDVNTQEGMKERVEDFFSKNFRDVTSRETIEWGDVVKTPEGNSSIRYKYRAKIWDKETKIMNQVFTFNPKGEYVSVKSVDGFPQDADVSAEQRTGAKSQTSAHEQSPQGPYRFQPLDILKIQVLGSILDQPIDGYYLVEPDGQVSLGPAYGRANVIGLTVEQAEARITQQLSKILTKPDVQVTMAGKATEWKYGPPPTASYTVSPGDLLLVRVLGTIIDQPIDAIYKVEPTGTVALGPAYGRAKVQGLTVEEATKAIQKKLSEVLKKPDVLVTFGGWEGVENVFGQKVGPMSRKMIDSDVTINSSTNTSGTRQKRTKPHGADIIEPHDVLSIELCDGGSIEPFLHQDFSVENTGSIPLGAAFGRVKVAGMTVEEAEKAIVKRMQEVEGIHNPKAQVILSKSFGDVDAFEHDVTHSFSTRSRSSNASPAQSPEATKPPQDSVPASQK
jgi:beta-lactamase regulating signal transducer with metallopeptidase domain/protein involved in polysaccharide export with SLBB domain